MIYLDNAATTRLDPEVLEAMMPFMQDSYGNAGSIYTLGRKAAEAIQTARQQVADLIGANPEQIIFTSGGTEANNLAILGCEAYLKNTGKHEIITSPVEHESVLGAIKELCYKSKGTKHEFYTSFLDVNRQGRVGIECLSDIISEDTGLVSVMCVNNEVGTQNPISKIGEICKKKNILFHTDCVQAAGTCEINVDDYMCDFLSISSHKIHGPKGIGALYVRDSSYLNPLIHGGAMQEFGLRGGTENVAGIVGFGKACEIVGYEIEKYRIHDIIDYKREEFIKILNENGLKGHFRINGAGMSDAGKIISLKIKGIDAETLILMLDSQGICVSAGSACTSHEQVPSRVLKAIGLSDDEAKSTIRISFSKFNTLDEVQTAALIFADCVKALLNV